jgi:hypothetical protein
MEVDSGCLKTKYRQKYLNMRKTGRNRIDKMTEQNCIILLFR